MMQRRQWNELVYYESALLRQCGVRHAFSTRVGGVSQGAFASLNLGNPTGVEAQDSWGNIDENYRRLQQAIGVAECSRCWVHQVHGCGVASVGAGFESGAQADALIGTREDQVLSVRTADCVPILISSGDGRTVSAVHAGWRGVVAEVVIRAIDAMKTDPAQVVAAVGPCIGYDSFEVGVEVATQFAAKFSDTSLLRCCRNGKARVDLRRAVRIQLEHAGVDRSSIDVSDRCTFRDHDEFFSHRRDNGITGRMAALIAPR